MKEHVIKLYITGKTPRSERAIANLHKICEEEFPDRYRIEVIDVLEKPQLAEQEKILATPTLVKHLPPPVRRVIGDLSDREKVLIGLDLHPEPEQEKKIINQADGTMSKSRSLEKLATHIPGFDHVADGGLPLGRATLVSGTAGSAKTALASQFPA